MKKEFYSNGKLLITGEYLVLDGAKAFALPTKFGQSLIVEETDSQEIKWKSFDSDGSLWYEDIFLFSEISSKDNSKKIASIRNTLLAILQESFLLNPDFIKLNRGYFISTQLTFQKIGV